ncbi:PREDICTED: uncharacterized protein LOC106124069 [Papilio xuthus]|uniref:Uncharacterized protein LOC106124069 n=1 Tax=Papilio xuthus TaxID=66420 RepID=A0AAJ7EFZ0_PAPXU|nr:PREDICTED: uncharacterized protein LOC106124069 [Papilio xuthus]
MLFNIFFIFGMVVAAHASIEGNKPILPLEGDLVSLITRKGEICVRESGVSPAIMHNLLPWRVEESEINGKFLLCLAKEMEFHDKDGKLKVEKFIDLFYQSLKSQDVDSYKKLLERCNELTGKNAYYTVYKIANCFHTNSPVKMALHVLVY